MTNLWSLFEFTIVTRSMTKLSDLYVLESLKVLLQYSVNDSLCCFYLSVKTLKIYLYISYTVSTSLQVLWRQPFERCSNQENVTFLDKYEIWASFHRNGQNIANMNAGLRKMVLMCNHVSHSVLHLMILNIRYIRVSTFCFKNHYIRA